MTAPTYLALLRGINVGGRNLIRMTDLAACFTDRGFADVGTYIQSGNVLFGSRETNLTTITRTVERMLSAAFGYDATVVIRSHEQVRRVVEGAPPGFGVEPDRFRCDVIFPAPPLTASAVMKVLTPREGVDAACAGHGVVYFSRLSERASQSRLSRFVSTPEYRRVTIRNWNTTTRLLALMDARR